jgi:hypothetical protein
MGKTTKIIFLDMDGVMNSHQSMYLYRRFFGVKDSWFEKYRPGSTDAYRSYEDEICPIALSNLSYILEEFPDARLVISSTWRRGRTQQWFTDLFKYFKLTTNRQCYYCDGEGKYSGGSPCKRCKTTGRIEHPAPEEVVVGMTPVMSGKDRGDEIQAWLDETDLTVDNFVILDDDSDMAHLRETHHFVQTQGEVGLDWHAVEKILKLFGGFSLSLKDLEKGTSYKVFSKPRYVNYIYDGEGGVYYYDDNGKKITGVSIFKNETFAKAN